MTSNGFLLADCADCERRVLLAYDVEDGSLFTRCLHCGVRIEGEDAAEASAAELLSLGYVVAPGDQPHGERGCRDGQCGVAQPDP